MAKKKVKKDAGDNSCYEKRQLISRDSQNVILAYDEEDNLFRTGNLTSVDAFFVYQVPDVVAWLQSIAQEK